MHLTFCGQSASLFNATHIEVACTTPGCFDSYIECIAANCSSQTVFLRDVVCGMNESGHLCWNSIASGVDDGEVSCTACSGADCTPACNSTVLAMADRLGCCASVYFNYTNIPLQFHYPTSTVFNQCQYEPTGTSCTAVSAVSTLITAQSPTTSTLAGLTLSSPSHPPSPSPSRSQSFLVSTSSRVEATQSSTPTSGSSSMCIMNGVMLLVVSLMVGNLLID